MSRAARRNHARRSAVDCQAVYAATAAAFHGSKGAKVFKDMLKELQRTCEGQNEIDG